jgi:hypothetical protein
VLLLSLHELLQQIGRGSVAMLDGRSRQSGVGWCSSASTLRSRDKSCTWWHQGMVCSAWWKDVWLGLWRASCGILSTPSGKEWLASSSCLHGRGRGANDKMQCEGRSLSDGGLSEQLGQSVVIVGQEATKVDEPHSVGRRVRGQQVHQL